MSFLNYLEHFLDDAECATFNSIIILTLNGLENVSRN